MLNSLDRMGEKSAECATNASSFAALVVDGRVEFDGVNSNRQQSKRLQSLPFSTDFTGPAMVSKFFQPKQLDTDGLKAALFRGHLLLGKTIKPPDSFAFYAAKEIQLEGGGDVKTFKIEDAVSSMEVWEYDELPDIRKKSLQNALVALQIANDLAT